MAENKAMQRQLQKQGSDELGFIDSGEIDNLVGRLTDGKTYRIIYPFLLTREEKSLIVAGIRRREGVRADRVRFLDARVKRESGTIIFIERR